MSCPCFGGDGGGGSGSGGSGSGVCYGCARNI